MTIKLLINYSKVIVIDNVNTKAAIESVIVIDVL